MLTFGCWNVKGYNVDKLKLQVFEKLDIFCLCESWITNASSISLPGYSFFFSSALKRKRRGRPSGGLIFYFRESLKNGISLQETNNNFIWIKMDKDFFNLENHLYVCAVYMKPSLNKVDSEENFNRFSSTVSKYSVTGNIMLMGDFDARTGTEPDFIQSERNYEHRHTIPLPEDYIYDNVCNRYNRDSIVNHHGACLLDLCKESNLKMLNGRHMGDAVGDFTFYNINGQSTIDYFIVSDCLLTEAVFFNILPPNDFSDHCILWSGFNFEYAISSTSPDNETNYRQLPGRFQCEKLTPNLYQEALLQPDGVVLIQDFVENLSQPEISINTLTEKITNILICAGIKTTPFRNNTKKRKKAKFHFRKRWFDKDCSIMQREVRSLGKRLQRDPRNYYLRQTFHRLRNEYNRTLKKKKSLFIQNVTNKLDSLHETNPKAFWQTINSLKNTDKTANNPVSLSKWSDYFSELLNKQSETLNLQNEERNNRNISLLDFEFTKMEVLDRIKLLKIINRLGLT